MSSVHGPVVPSRGRFRPLGLDEVEITGGFWARLQEVNASSTLAHCQDWMERLGWVGNFPAVVDGTIANTRKGREFADSDVYKLMEAMAWESGRSGSADAEQRFHDLVEVIAPAQEDDGYLNTCFGHRGQPARYSDLEWGHELYCFGHLLQSAVARQRTGGDDRWVEVARRAADHVCDTFGPGGIERVGGHPEIELGLAEFARVTGEERYLRQAARFVDRRGNHTLADIERGRAYYQDDVPIREATAFRGHAVRALYLAAGAVDVAVETDDRELLEVVISQWEHTIARRTYLTGGMGSQHEGEAFGEDWVLPADRAYSETCAGVASVMLAWRLLLATGEARFADLLERTMFNVVATSPAPDGRAFFYANPLHQRTPGTVPPGDVESPRASSSLRAPWFSVSCCPTNVARTLAAFAAYLATTDDRGVQLHQYADCRISTSLTDGRSIGLEVATAYPREGKVVVTVTETDGRPVALMLRIPGWATGAAVLDEGTRREASPGWFTVERAFAPGERIELVLPLAPRWTHPDPRIDAVRGAVAVERGPIVLCLESVDLPDGYHVDDVVVDPTRPVQDDGDSVTVTGRLMTRPEEGWPYGERAGPPEGAARPLTLRPYHDWATRGPATMRVWMPVTEGGD